MALYIAFKKKEVEEIKEEVDPPAPEQIEHNPLKIGKRVRVRTFALLEDQLPVSCTSEYQEALQILADAGVIQINDCYIHDQISDLKRRYNEA